MTKQKQKKKEKHFHEDKYIAGIEMIVSESWAVTTVYKPSCGNRLHEATAWAIGKRVFRFSCCGTC